MRRAAFVLLVLVVACTPQRGGTAVPHTPVAGASPAASPTWSPSPPRHFPVSAGGIVEYPIPNQPDTPSSCAPFCQGSVYGLVLGPDGNIWFEDNTHKAIGRITRAGIVSEFRTQFELDGGANTMAAGPDGAIWVTASGGGGGNPDWILRVSPAGEITQFSAGDRDPSKGQFGTGPESITLGPDGNLWFDEFWTNRIGRLTPSGTLTEFPIPTPDSSPRGIVAGPDGNLWFVEEARAAPAIARITTSGVISEFPITGGPADMFPYAIVNGPDGDLWFTEGNGLAHISTSGQVVQVPLPSGSSANALVAGPDGNLWFGDSQKSAIARMSLTGAIREFPLPRRGVTPSSLAVGADGRIWFGESGLAIVASVGVRVPEVEMSRRPVIFTDQNRKEINLRNTGDAPLAISAVHVAGIDANLFTLSNDSCAGSSLAPDASCSVQLRHTPGGPAGIQSAMLEVTDNATGSPQRVSLIAQPPQCTLPVVTRGEGSAPGVGAELVVSRGDVIPDPSASIPGHSPGYYDRAYGKWLPVGASAVSPDGSRYAYLTGVQGPQTSEVRVVDVASGRETAWKLTPGFWAIVSFARDGIYMHLAYEGVGLGVTVLDPDTGNLKTALADSAVFQVDGSSAWVGTQNPDDKSPQPPGEGGGYNQVMKRDLVTGTVTTWLYRPGTYMYVLAVANGSPVISVYDGLESTYWLVTAPERARQLDFPLETNTYPSLSGFTGDTTGMWIGSVSGVYIWTPRTGSVLVTDQPATPAGTCA